MWRRDPRPGTHSPSPVGRTLTSEPTATAADAVDSILDDPTMQDIVALPRHSIRNMEQGGAVYNLLYSKKCFASHPSWTGKKPYDEWTHVLMHGEFGGGFKLEPQPAAEKQFLLNYALDLRNGSTHYIIERKTPFFKFHADLDIKRSEPMDEENMVMLMKDFAHCVRKFYPSTTSVSRFDMMVCTSFSPGKTGIHVTFPNLIVNQDQAFDIRNYYVSYLISKYGDRVGLQNSWEEIVDTSVYEANGLRLVGSHKTEDCPDCRGETKRRKKKDAPPDSPRRNHCTLCGGRGRIDTGKVYKPWMYLRDGQPHAAWTDIVRAGVWMYLKDGVDRHAVIELCSIRCCNVNETSSDFAVSDEDMAQQIQASRTRTTATQPSGRPHSPRERIYRQVETELGTYRMTEEDAKSMAKWKKKKFINPRSEAFQLIQEFIQSKNFPLHWRNLSIHNMFSNPAGTHYIVNVRGEGQRFCLNNRKGHHRSNNIYFYIEHGTVVQRCHCSCPTTENRKHGLCEKFSSEPISLTTKINKTLFPVLDEKLGHLHAERSLSALQDLDEYTLRVASVITKLDEARNVYLEERRQRLTQPPATHPSANQEIPVQARKRRRKPPAAGATVQQQQQRQPVT